MSLNGVPIENNVTTLSCFYKGFECALQRRRLQHAHDSHGMGRSVSCLTRDNNIMNIVQTCIHALPKW